MKKIISPVDRELIKAELQEDKFLRKTNHAGNEIYVVGPESVNVIREIGRLREIAFRNDGGGTGEALDIDKFDTDPAFGYKQLVLWDPETEEIIGGYRFCFCDQCVYDKEGQPILTSSHMFRFSRKFMREYLPYTLELGRSFVSVEYQSSKAGAKGLFALDNLFDGISALMVLYKKRMRYLFGKMTIYPSYNEEAREMIMFFLKKYFGEKASLIHIRKEVRIQNPRRFSKLFKGDDFKEDYKTLKGEILKLGVSIPPLVNSYMNLSPSMIYFGTGINDEFADVLDSGIMITFEEMYPEKKKRHVESFLKEGWKMLRNRLKKLERRR
ncbi:MAG: GNAT family N-acetyltransferase [Bacteroidales bacterium]|nr:GNAT family N-acetyltransferase [Bacteroidales bacterium]